TAQLLLRLDQDVLQLRPAVAVLALGGNDLTSIGVLPEREKEIVEACTKNLLEAADRMHARGIHVVLLTVFPVGQVGLSRRPVWSAATLAAVAEVNRALRAAKGPGLTVVDCDPVLAVDGRLNPAYYAADRWHVNAAGYQALNEHLRPVLADLVRAP